MTTIDQDRLDEEQQTDRFTELVHRLNRQSVDKHFDAYQDVPWDDPDYAIRHDDPRWEIFDEDGLGGTDWYRSLPAETRARLGLHVVASDMKAGLQFESILKRGLLEYAFRLPDGSPEFRYTYHEVIEEAHHSLMFQEFVNRAGLATPGLSWDLRLGSRRVIGLARRSPAMFFVFVLGGEDPIDHVQRKLLRSDKEIHPLLERIMRIHVTEEARHLSFARSYLRTNVPKLSGLQRQAMAIQAPFILGQMASVMMRMPRHLVRAYDIPKSVLREVYGPGTKSRQEVKDSVRKVRNLLIELDLVNPVSKQIWRRYDIWDD